MKLYALPVAVAIALVGLQLLSTQPVEAKGRKHHMRDQYSRQQAFYANPGANYGYGAGYNMPQNYSFNQGRPSSGMYGNDGNNRGHGQRNGGFFGGNRRHH